MKKAFKHLTLEERIDIERLLNSGKSFSQIAVQLGKNRTTISREVKGRRVNRETDVSIGQLAIFPLPAAVYAAGLTVPADPTAASATWIVSASGKISAVRQ